jgi:hypothetical protein
VVKGDRGNNGERKKEDKGVRRRRKGARNRQGEGERNYEERRGARREGGEVDGGEVMRWEVGGRRSWEEGWRRKERGI